MVIHGLKLYWQPDRKVFLKGAEFFGETGIVLEDFLYNKYYFLILVQMGSRGVRLNQALSGCLVCFGNFSLLRAVGASRQ